METYCFLFGVGTEVKETIYDLNMEPFTRRVNEVGYLVLYKVIIGDIIAPVYERNIRNVSLYHK